jgi:DNA adenine methylase
VSYWGGKQLLLPRILPIIPPHKKYVECFLGGGAVFWAKPPSEIEVINDLDGFVANFYEVSKRHSKNLLGEHYCSPFFVLIEFFFLY